MATLLVSGMIATTGRRHENQPTLPPPLVMSRTNASPPRPRPAPLPKSSSSRPSTRPAAACAAGARGLSKTLRANAKHTEQGRDAAPPAAARQARAQPPSRHDQSPPAGLAVIRPQVAESAAAYTTAPHPQHAAPHDPAHTHGSPPDTHHSDNPAHNTAASHASPAQFTPSNHQQRPAHHPQVSDLFQHLLTSLLPLLHKVVSPTSANAEVVRRDQPGARRVCWKCLACHHPKGMPASRLLT